MVSGFERILTVDGATGAGKTSLLRALAARYPAATIELGPVVRTVSWLSVTQRLSVPDAIAALARLDAVGRVAIDRSRAGPLAASDVELDGVPLGARVFSAELATATAAASLDGDAMAWIHGFVRAHLRGRAGAVSGREAARMVCPTAGLRIRLEADARVRAERKRAQLRAFGLGAAFLDDVALLRPGDDVDAVIDTTYLDCGQVALRVFVLVERELAWRPMAQVRRPDAAVDQRSQPAFLVGSV